MVKIADLKKSFGKNEVLKGISYDIKEGKITTILGPNGSGKTTLIKSVLGLVIPDSGKIIINENEIKNKFDYRKQIGYMPQIARFPENLKVKELFSMIKNLRNQQANEDYYIELFELQEFIKRPLRYLSGGTRQKVNAACAMMFDAPILVFDEPTVGLDPLTLVNFKKHIRAELKKNKTIILTTHIISLVEELADEIVFLLEGKIFFKGSVQQLKSQEQENNLENAIANILIRKKNK